MKRLALIAIICALFPLLAPARPIIADLSEDRIYIGESFTGKNILLFGARNDPGDVVVILRGPLRDYTLRKKARVFGIWVNHEQTKFRGVPDFYKIYSTRPLQEVVPDSLRSALGVGMDAIGITPNKPIPEASAKGFQEAFMQQQTRRGLFFQEGSDAFSFMGQSLFKIPIAFPDTIPDGEYSAEVYLFADGQLMAVQSIPLSVARSGFDAVITRMADQQSVLYGTLAVLLALGIGWLGNHLFRKN
jgi:uncharacterized protein (TIGR02186 family)